MKKKFLFLSAIITSCVFAFISGQSMAELHPNMPTSGGGGYRCYSNGQYGQNTQNSGPAYYNNSNSQYAPYGQAQSGPYTYGQGQRAYSNSNSRYNDHNNGNAPAAMKLQDQSAERFQGTVSSLNRVQYPDGTQIEMILDTDEGTKRVMLGPSKFVDQSKVKIQSGDKVAILGYRVGANGNEVIVAQEINKHGNVLKLRDDQRQPAWGSSRWGSSYSSSNSQPAYGANSSSRYSNHNH